MGWRLSACKHDRMRRCYIGINFEMVLRVGL
jgi:hypothetical protein